MVTLMRARYLAAVAAIPLLVVGCGSSGTSKAVVQKDVLQYVKDSIGKPNVTADEPNCTKSGGAWNCDILLHAPGGKTKQIQVQATCNGDHCTYELTSLG
jgi:hypothetical protein